MQKVGRLDRAFVHEGCLTMTYFRTGNPYYHRRAAVSRSCSGWEGVVPAGYGRQALRAEGKVVGCIGAVRWNRAGFTDTCPPIPDP